MSDKIFSELRVRYQIQEHIPIRLPYENEKCVVMSVCMMLCLLSDLGFC